jgi:hypothetical protein
MTTDELKWNVYWVLPQDGIVDRFGLRERYCQFLLENNTDQV